MHRIRHAVLTAALLLFCASPSSAVPFDLLVASEITVNTSGPETFVLFWPPNDVLAAIVATDEMIDFGSQRKPCCVVDSDSALLSVESDVPGVDYVGDILISPLPGLGIAPGQALMTDTDTYESLLAPGETAIDRETAGFYMFTAFIMPAHLSGNANLDVTWQIRSKDSVHAATYRLVITFDPTLGLNDPKFIITNTQRVSAVAVPEPSALALVSAVSPLLALRRIRKRSKPRAAKGN